MFQYNQEDMQAVSLKPDRTLYVYLFRKHTVKLDALKLCILYLMHAKLFRCKASQELFLRLSEQSIHAYLKLCDLELALNGVDARYLDVCNDDTPADFAISYEEPVLKLAYESDAAALELKLYTQEQKLIDLLCQGMKLSSDTQTMDVLHSLVETHRNLAKQLKALLDTGNHPDGFETFGLGGDEKEFDLDTENYFDKRNPYFENLSI